MTDDELATKISEIVESDKLVVILMEMLTRVTDLEDRVKELEGPPIKLGKRA